MRSITEFYPSCHQVLIFLFTFQIHHFAFVDKQSCECLLSSPDTPFVSLTHTPPYTFLIYFASTLTLPSHSMQYWVPLLSFDFYYFFFFILLSNSETLVLRRLQTKDLQPTSFSFCVRRNLPDGPGNTFPTVLQLGKLLNSALL